MSLVVFVILLILLIGGLPVWEYHSYGYAPSGLAGIFIVILIVLLLTGRL